MRMAYIFPRSSLATGGVDRLDGILTRCDAVGNGVVGDRIYDFDDRPPDEAE
jgi:hypothetical protein